MVKLISYNGAFHLPVKVFTTFKVKNGTPQEYLMNFINSVNNWKYFFNNSCPDGVFFYMKEVSKKVKPDSASLSFTEMVIPGQKNVFVKVTDKVSTPTIGLDLFDKIPSRKELVGKHYILHAKTLLKCFYYDSDEVFGFLRDPIYKLKQLQKQSKEPKIALFSTLCRNIQLKKTGIKFEDETIKFFVRTKLGFLKALNKQIKKAKGDEVVFLSLETNSKNFLKPKFGGVYFKNELECGSY